MTLFASHPTYNPYRTMSLHDPMTVGEDVFGLQTALNAAGFDCGTADGAFGQATLQAVVAAQRKLGLTADGLAGEHTQQALVSRLSTGVRTRYGLPSMALFGQVEHESSFLLGNYSPTYPNGSYDAGVAQRNTAFTPPRDGFDVPKSLDALGRSTSSYYEAFAGVENRRRWALAMGGWNAPAFACFIANEEGASVPRWLTARPSDAARATLEAYIAAVTKYL